MINANIHTPKTRNFKKIQKMFFAPGTYTIRILESDFTCIPTHYVVGPGGKASVTCLGDDCPICKNNRSIMLDYPRDYYKTPGYIGISYRHVFNVMDRSRVKKCPECGTESYRNLDNEFPTVCPSCQTLLTDVTPEQSNTVKLMQISNTDAQTLMLLEKSVQDADENVIGILNYDIRITAGMIGGKKQMSYVPVPSSNDPINIKDDTLFDHSLAFIKLTPEELRRFMSGASIKAIFMDRKEAVPAEGPDTKQIATLTSELTDVSDSINSMF